MNVSIRPLVEQDAYVSIKWRNQPDLWRYTLAAGREGPSLEQELAWIKEVIADPESSRFAIMADGTYVGNVYLTGIRDGSAEYHIFIGERSCWGKGVARAATQLIVSFAWDELALDQVYLAVHSDNVTAHTLYRSVGFVPQELNDKFIRMTLDRPTRFLLALP